MEKTMTKEQRFKVAAKAAMVFGPALTVVSVLGVLGYMPLTGEALRIAPIGTMLGVLTFLLGNAAHRA